MLNPRLMIVAFVLVLVSGPASARRPWQPRATVEAAECIGRRKPEIDPKVARRFDKLYLRAGEMFRAGSYRRARKLLDIAIGLNPDHVGARMLHARVLLTLGYLTWNLPMIQEARADIRHAQAIDPKNPSLQSMVELLDGLLRRMQAASRKAPRKTPRKPL